jgi:hypothetical protein
MSPSDRLPALPVRFFGPDQNAEEYEIVEITEGEFLDLLEKGHAADYARHTVRENGVAQICLTIVT